MQAQVPERRRRPLRAVAATSGVIALLAAAVGGCGGGDGSATTSAADTPSGTPVKVMTYADITVTPPAPSAKFITESVKAAIDAANARGGINGHPIDLITCDTKMNPNAATTCGRQAVQERVVAVVGGESLFDAQIATLVERAGIPMIGPIPLSPPVFNGALTYCHTAQTSTTLNMLPKIAGQVGVRKLSLIINGGTPITQLNIDAFKRGTAAAGLEVGNIVTPSAQTTNFTAAATEAAANGADGVIVLPLIQTASIAQQIKEQAPDLKIILPSFVFSFGGDWPTSLNGTTVVTAVQPPTATNVPGIKRYRADMEKYAPATDLTETSAYEWLAGDWFVRVAREIHGDVTSQSIVAAMNGLHDFDMGGITPPYDSAKRGKVAVEKCGENGTVVQAELRDNLLYAVDPGKFVE